MKEPLSVRLERQLPAVLLIVTTITFIGISWAVYTLALQATQYVQIVMAYQGPIDTAFVKLMFAIAFIFWFVNSILTWGARYLDYASQLTRDMREQVKLKYQKID